MLLQFSVQNFLSFRDRVTLNMLAAEHIQHNSSQVMQGPGEHQVLRTATHIAFDGATTERLLRLGASTVLRASDCLLIGPSRRDALEHTRARQAWWNSSEDWDQLASFDASGSRPMVVWVSQSIHERVNLWRTLHRIHHAGISSHEVFVIEFNPVPSSGIPEEPVPPFDCGSSVADHPDPVLLEHLANAYPWPHTRYHQAVQLWDLYPSESCTFCSTLYPRGKGLS